MEPEVQPWANELSLNVKLLTKTWLLNCDFCNADNKSIDKNYFKEPNIYLTFLTFSFTAHSVFFLSQYQINHIIHWMMRN